MSGYRDETLVAYLDGELEPSAAAALEQTLARDPTLRDRLAALEMDVGAIRQAFDEFLLETDSAAPGDLTTDNVTPDPDAAAPRRQSLERQNRRAGMLGAAALLAVGVALGVLGARAITGDAPETWRDHAATYHMLYAPETLARVDADPVRLAMELSNVSAILGRDIAPETLKAPDLIARRAQMLKFEGRPIMQIAFTTTDGAPIALCVSRASRGAGDTPLIRAEMRGMSAMIWSDGGYEFLLIGGEDQELLEQTARILKPVI